MQETPTKDSKYIPFDVEAETSSANIVEPRKESSQSHESMLWNTIHLNPGISKLNFFCCVLFYCSMVFGFTAANALQPLILTDKNYYNINQNRTGEVLSLIMVVQLIVKIIVGIPYGHFVDKFGRKTMIVFGTVCYLASFILVPLQTTLFPGLISAKILLANAISCFHSVPLMIDYISNESRGRASALLSMAIGISSIIATICVRKLFEENFSIGSCYMIFGMGISLVMIVNVFGLKGGYYYNENTQQGRSENIVSLRHNIREVLGHFKENGWLMIGLMLQILGSPDFMVFFMFMSLFIKSMFPENFDAKTANITVTNFHIMVTLASFFCNIFYGWFLDKKNKPLTAVYIALIGGSCALFLFSTSRHPDDWTLFLGAPLIGATLPALFVITNFINIKNFPPEKRGIMISFTGLAGNISHFLIASTGGLLYDHISKSGPFIICSILLIIAVFAVTYIHKTKVAFGVSHS